jgi:hypothetical protein
VSVTVTEESRRSICAQLTERCKLCNTVGQRDKLEDLTEWAPEAVSIQPADNYMFLVNLYRSENKVV